MTQTRGGGRDGGRKIRFETTLDVDDTFYRNIHIITVLLHFLLITTPVLSNRFRDACKSA